jgi:chromosome segregation ATPase
MKLFGNLTESAQFEIKKTQQAIVEIVQSNKQLEGQFDNLEGLIKSVIDRHENEFMTAYNIYVKKKEKDLIEIIQTLELRNKKNNLLDLKIKNLEAHIVKLRHEANESENAKEKLRRDIREQKSKCDLEREEKEFYHKQALEAKKKNKLFKVAVGRL